MTAEDAASVLGPAARFLRADDLAGAAGAVAYIAAMLAGRVSGDEIALWCYEFAAAGVPYANWPDMALARLENDLDGGDAEMRRTGVESLAQALEDHGEIETLRLGVSG